MREGDCCQLLTVPFCLFAGLGSQTEGNGMISSFDASLFAIAIRTERQHRSRAEFATLVPLASEPTSYVSDLLKPLHLKVVFGRNYRFQNVDFCQVAEAPRKVRGKGFSFMYSRKFRGRATFQSREQGIVVFLHARK